MLGNGGGEGVHTVATMSCVLSIVYCGGGGEKARVVNLEMCPVCSVATIASYTSKAFD